MPQPHLFTCSVRFGKFGMVSEIIWIFWFAKCAKYANVRFIGQPNIEQAIFFCNWYWSTICEHFLVDLTTFFSLIIFYMPTRRLKELLWHAYFWGDGHIYLCTCRRLHGWPSWQPLIFWTLILVPICGRSFKNLSPFARVGHILTCSCPANKKIRMNKKTGQKTHSRAWQRMLQISEGHHRSCYVTGQTKQNWM